MMTGPDGIAPDGGMVSVGPGGAGGIAGPGTGSVPGAEPDDEPVPPGVSDTEPFGIGLGIGKAAGEVTSGAWARAVATGRPRAAAGPPSWANAPGTAASMQPKPNRIRFIDPPSGQ
jgi:hypothetical protein